MSIFNSISSTAYLSTAIEAEVSGDSGNSQSKFSDHANH
jgi:hypothetical protein